MKYEFCDDITIYVGYNPSWKRQLRAQYTSETIYQANFLSGVFTAGIFLPGLIILANLLSGVFTAAGITEPPSFLSRGTS